MPHHRAAKGDYDNWLAVNPSQRGAERIATINSRSRKRRPQPGVHRAPLERTSAEITAVREADRLTVKQFAPPAVLINANLQVLQFRGPTGAYLEPPKGKGSFDVLKMARNGLCVPL